MFMRDTRAPGTSSESGQADRKQFYRDIDAYALAPLWEVMSDLVPREPTTPCVPYDWKWEVVRQRLIQAGTLISAEEAERRVLVLENPGMRGASCATHSLYAGVQMILPGEIAPEHRHSATAIRLIMSGQGGYTSVNGREAEMQRGDFIITPSWTWHGHGNRGAEPVFWLDGLDVPLVRLLDAAFSDAPRLPEPDAAIQRSTESRFDGQLMPVDYTPGSSNPVFRYPYERTRALLEGRARTEALDPAHGIKLRFSHPGTGGWATRTLGATMQWFPAGFVSLPYRSTDASIVCVVEGSGHSMIGQHRVDWDSNDVFMIPSWVPVAHHPRQDAVLYAMSDRPAQDALGLWREAEY